MMPEPEYDMSPEEIYGEGERNAADWQNEAMQHARDVDEHGERLSPWEIEFIAAVIDGKAQHISRRMAGKITQIYEDRVT